MPRVKQRSLRFSDFDEVLVEVGRLATIPVQTRGNCSLGEILEHLARAMDVVTGHIQTLHVAWPMRMVARLIRPLVLRKMSPGFKLPAAAQSLLWPAGPLETPIALVHFHESLDRYRNATKLPPHPFFGSMSREQADRIQLNHCALHLSFVHPTEE